MLFTFCQKGVAPSPSSSPSQPVPVLPLPLPRAGRASSARVGVRVCVCVCTAVVVCFGLPLIVGPLFLQFELSSSDTHSRCSNFSLMLLFLLLFCCFFFTFIFIVILGFRPGLPLLLAVVLGTDHESTEKFASMGKLCKQ